MNNKRFIFPVVFGTIFLFLFFTLYFFKQEFERPKLPLISPVKPFTLTDQNQKQVGLKNLHGRVWVASFFFTTCGDICPMMSKHMASLSRTFEGAPSVALVSISVNPEFDTPEVLNSYAKKYDARKNWFFLTGSREEISEIALNSFKLGSIEEPVFHSSYFTLVDRSGFIRGYYDGTKTEDIQKLFKEAARLIKER
jgi:protein SCO1/2